FHMTDDSYWAAVRLQNAADCYDNGLGVDRRRGRITRSRLPTFQSDLFGHFADKICIGTQRPAKYALKPIDIVWLANHAIGLEPLSHLPHVIGGPLRANTAQRLFEPLWIAHGRDGLAELLTPQPGDVDGSQQIRANKVDDLQRQRVRCLFPSQ